MHRHRLGQNVTPGQKAGCEQIRAAADKATQVRGGVFMDVGWSGRDKPWRTVSVLWTNTGFLLNL